MAPEDGFPEMFWQYAVRIEDGKKGSGELISLAEDRPDTELIPWESLREASAAAWSKSREAAATADPAGSRMLQAFLADAYRKQSGEICGAEELLLAGSGLAALDIVLRCCHKPGEAVAVEAPADPEALRLLRQHGAAIVQVDSDKDGMMPDALTAICAKYAPKLAVVSPDSGGPFGQNGWSLARREALLKIALDRGLTIIELEEQGKPWREGGTPSLFALWRQMAGSAGDGAGVAGGWSDTGGMSGAESMGSADRSGSTGGLSGTGGFGGAGGAGGTGGVSGTGGIAGMSGAEDQYGSKGGLSGTGGLNGAGGAGGTGGVSRAGAMGGADSGSGTGSAGGSGGAGKLSGTSSFGGADGVSGVDGAGGTGGVSRAGAMSGADSGSGTGSAGSSGGVIAIGSLEPHLPPLGWIRAAGVIRGALLAAKAAVSPPGAALFGERVLEHLLTGTSAAGRLSPAAFEASLQRVYSERRQLVLKQLAEPAWQGTVPLAGGGDARHVWALLPEGASSIALLRAALLEGAAFLPGPHAYLSGRRDAERLMRLSVTGYGREPLRTALDRIASALEAFTARS